MALSTAACQAPLSVGVSRQECWSGLPCPPPGGLPDPGIEPVSYFYFHLQTSSLPPAPPGKPPNAYICIYIQAGIKIAGRNINNLSYANDTSFMSVTKAELRSLLMKMQEDSEKAGLKLNI